MNIDVNVYCELEQTQIDGFSNLFNELTSIVYGEDDVSCFRGVYIVEDGQVSSTVNTIIQTVEPDATYVPSEDYPANATAVPIETSNGLVCFIVLSCELLRPLKDDYYHHQETVLALIEELLHTQFYTSLRQARGYVQQTDTDKGNPCTSHLRHIASQMCDEYFVIRKKTYIINTIPLIQLESVNGLVTGHLQYGGDVAASLNRGFDILDELVSSTTGRTQDSDPVWKETVQFLYRDIFEPLARNLAYQDSMGNEVPDRVELESFGRYGMILARYWCDIQDQLKFVFDRNLKEIEGAIGEIAKLIGLFLEKSGIVC